MMKSPYAHQHISLTGHSVEFEAGVIVWVPQNEQLVSECLALGATLVSGEVPEDPAPAAPKEKSDNILSFKVELDKALTRILVRNDPADLKADLMPKLNKVVAEMSPDLRRPTDTEVSDAYQRLQENIDLAE
jgi:hypothetical protein